MHLSPYHRFTCCFLVLAAFLGGCAGQSAKTADVSPKPASLQSLPGISLKEFYKFPVGPRGFEPTEKLLSLKDKKVRITGYMVKEEEPSAGLFMLAPLPVSLSEKEDGPADDLPAATLFVHMPPVDAGKVVQFRDGLWELSGTLKLGNHEEANGRVSYTQLVLD